MTVSSLSLSAKAIRFCSVRTVFSSADLGVVLQVLVHPRPVFCLLSPTAGRFLRRGILGPAPRFKHDGDDDAEDGHKHRSESGNKSHDTGQDRTGQGTGTMLEDS